MPDDDEYEWERVEQYGRTDEEVEADCRRLEADGYEHVGHHDRYEPNAPGFWFRRKKQQT